MSVIQLAFVGCGSFVREIHLENIMATPLFQVHAAVDLTLSSAQQVAKTAGAAYWTDDVERVLNDPVVDLIFIATPHHSHAELSIRAARSGKHIFCEKPMALNEADALAVCEAVEQAGVKYMSGYNRTFAPFTGQVKGLLDPIKAPKQIFHRIADWNPYGHGWLLDEQSSGGRLVGESGHAIDMMCQIVGLDPVRVYAEGGNYAEPSPSGAPDSANITLGFPDGSTGVLVLSSVGSNAFPKEEVQIFCAGHTVNIRNFQAMDIYTPNGKRKYALPAVDKGLKSMLDALSAYLLEDRPTGNNARSAFRTTRCTLAAARSVWTHQLQLLG